ncbi:MAG TPA: hypothetical protein VKG44_03770 [Candidatus Baltobacteraceae bacterium]|nr:hypothetical protein [Candidatus Baltobacteraceae bacterium]
MTSSASINSAINGRNLVEFSPPYAAIVLATFVWSLTVQGRSAGAAVPLDWPPSCLVDGVEDGSRVDKIFVSAVETSGELAFVHAIIACRNEKIGDSDAEGIGDSLKDLHPDIDRCAFDSRNGRARNSSSKSKRFLRKAGLCPSDDDIDT